MNTFIMHYALCIKVNLVFFANQHVTDVVSRLSGANELYKVWREMLRECL